MSIFRQVGIFMLFSYVQGGYERLLEENSGGKETSASRPWGSDRGTKSETRKIHSLCTSENFPCLCSGNTDRSSVIYELR